MVIVVQSQDHLDFVKCVYDTPCTGTRGIPKYTSRARLRLCVIVSMQLQSSVLDKHQLMFEDCSDYLHGCSCNKNMPGDKLSGESTLLCRNVVRACFWRNGDHHVENDQQSTAFLQSGTLIHDKGLRL